MPFPRWITGLLVLAALALVPWTLWLTFSLPSKHVAHHYDVAWVGFDIALGAMFGLTARAAVRRSELLAPVAAATAAMLVCDAWFDVVTSTPPERLEALLQAGFAELPLAALCAFIAYDVERAHASVARLRRRR
jgi:predicted branched-subunit amino acid permease